MPRILWAPAPSAVFVPIRFPSRWDGAAREGSRRWAAAPAACPTAAWRAGLPLAVLPDRRLPAAASWPGHRPAPLARGPAVGKRPIAPRSPRPSSGRLARPRLAWCPAGVPLPLRQGQAAPPAPSAWGPPPVSGPLRVRPKSGCFCRKRLRARAAILGTAVSPAANARNMARPLPPRASLAPCPRFILPLSIPCWRRGATALWSRSPLWRERGGRAGHGDGVGEGHWL